MIASRGLVNVTAETTLRHDVDPRQPGMILGHVRWVPESAFDADVMAKTRSEI